MVNTDFSQATVKSEQGQLLLMQHPHHTDTHSHTLTHAEFVTLDMNKYLI